MLLGRTVIEEIYQNERRLTQFSRFSTKQMFPTDRPPWADAKNRAQYKEGVALPVRIPITHRPVSLVTEPTLTWSLVCPRLSFRDERRWNVWSL